MTFWNATKRIFNAVIHGVPDLYEFLDVSEGRLTPEEAYEIILPTALESGLVCEIENAKIGCRNMWLAKDNKLNRIIWMFDFGLLEVDGEKMAEQMEGLGSIDLDDETGEILAVSSRMRSDESI